MVKSKKAVSVLLAVMLFTTLAAGRQPVYAAVFPDISRKIICIGDSYGGIYDGVTTSLPETLKSYLGSDVSEFYYSFIAGAGFVNGLFLNGLTTINPSDKSKITDIYIMGGWNDENGRPNVTYDSFISAITTFKDYCNTNYPNAKLHLIFISWGYLNGNGQVGGNNQNLLTTKEWYNNAGSNGYITHSEASFVMHNKSLFSNDLLHPNQDGINKLAKCIKDIILNGNFHTYSTSIKPFIPSEDFAIEPHTNASIIEIQNNENVIISFETGPQNFMLTAISENGVDLTLDGNGRIFGSYEMGIIKGHSNYYSVQTSFVLIDTQNKNYNIGGLMTFLEGDIYLSFNYTCDYSAQNNLLPLNLNVKHIIIGGFKSMSDIWGG